jgi:hypothetical protein
VETDKDASTPVEAPHDKCPTCGSNRADSKGYEASAEFGRIACRNPWHAASTPVEEKCGQPATSFIPRWGMSFACVLPKGHGGDHQRGGYCLKHGEYIGEKCPQWPNCIQGLPTAASTPVDESGYDNDADTAKALDVVERDFGPFRASTPVEAPLGFCYDWNTVGHIGPHPKSNCDGWNPIAEQPSAPRSQPDSAMWCAKRIKVYALNEDGSFDETIAAEQIEAYVTKSSGDSPRSTAPQSNFEKRLHEEMTKEFGFDEYDENWRPDPNDVKAKMYFWLWNKAVKLGEALEHASALAEAPQPQLLKHLQILAREFKRLNYAADSVISVGHWRDDHFYADVAFSARDFYGLLEAEAPQPRRAQPPTEKGK